MTEVASPDPPLARLQRTTPTATSIQRDVRSPSQPNTGENTMYETRNAVASQPIWACVAPKYSRMSGSTAASTCRST